MAEQNDEYTDLAQLAAKLPVERRRMLEGQLPFSSNPPFDAGLVAGLASALHIVQGEHGAEAAGVLQEAVAVAAARVMQEKREYERLREEHLTPAVREEVEREIARIESGEVPVFPVEDLLKELETIELSDDADGDEKNGRLKP